MITDCIEVDNITKVCGKGKEKTVAVEGLSLTIRKGEIFGLVGPNGAGKTTTIKMIVNLLSPDHGSISIFGIENKNVEAMRMTGYMPEDTVPLEYLNGREFLQSKLDLLLFRLKLGIYSLAFTIAGLWVFKTKEIWR